MVILVSDMLEHSTITSFYLNRDIRTIDPEIELARADSATVFGDFGGARVIVIGAGLLPPDVDAGRTRNTATLAALRQFWTEWFRRSKATLSDYGQPDLVDPVMP